MQGYSGDAAYRLAGIPERVFVIVDFDWDRGKVRIKEVGGTGRYVLPWDCLEFVEEQQIVVPSF